MLMAALTRGALLCKTLGMGVKQRQKKPCAECKKAFLPTGANCKRCPPCRRKHALAVSKERWHRTYVKKGRNQAGSSNNAWKGGTSPAYYRRVCFEAHGRKCFRCGGVATLVHHRDEDRSNSATKNLAPMCKRCHQLEHDCASNLPKVVIFKRKPCVICLRRFQPTGPRHNRCPRCAKSV